MLRTAGFTPLTERNSASLVSAKLPNFLGLAELIAREKGITLTIDDKSHLDRYVGQQEQDGFNVREHTRRI